MSGVWFRDTFGFEEMTAFEANRNNFRLLDGPEGPGTILHSLANDAKFMVGPFSTPTVAELREMVYGADGTGAKELEPLGGMTFGHITNCDVRSLIRDARCAGSVVQAASQFNCLEMVGPGVMPEHGITNYASDATQGPACALACPAGTVYRNYFAPDGHGQAGGDGKQINGMRKVEELVDNKKHNFWNVHNGYLLPTSTSSMSEFTKYVGGADSGRAKQIIAAISLGVQWKTDVYSSKIEWDKRQTVCQVYASAVPIAYAKSTTVKDWDCIANLVLRAMYEGTILVAGALARKEKRRVTVYLTQVGGSAFGNLHQWILRAMLSAMEAHAALPIDVREVHYGGTAPSVKAPPGVKEVKTRRH